MAKTKVDPLEGVYVITCCTSTRTEVPVVRCSSLDPDATMNSALNQWLALLNKHKPTITPSELYRGIGFHVVMRIQEIIGAKNIRVLTGGQGLLELDTKIVPYDFTSNKNHPGNILEVVTAEPFVIPLWWQMINKAMRGSGTPVADILNSSNSTLVIIALNKFFLKYLQDDLLSASQEGLAKLRIIVTGKSRSSIPMQLRQNVVQCSKAISNSTMGNRNDLNHRAALQFIKLIRAGEINIAESSEYHQRAIGIPDDTNVARRMTPDEVLGKAPQLLEHGDPDEAFAHAKRVFGTFGGIVAFRAEWYRRTGKIEEMTMNTKPTKAALTALGHIKSTIEGRGAKVSTHQDTDAAYKYIAEFISAIRTEAPTAKFNAGDIHTWITSYCDETEESIPVGLSGTQKIAQFLSGSFEVLGLHKIKIGQGGSTLYQLK